MSDVDDGKKKIKNINPCQRAGAPMARPEESCPRLTKLRAVLSKAVDASLRGVGHGRLATAFPKSLSRHADVLEAHHAQFVQYYQENVQAAPTPPPPIR